MSTASFYKLEDWQFKNVSLPLKTIIFPWKKSIESLSVTKIQQLLDVYSKILTQATKENYLKQIKYFGVQPDATALKLAKQEQIQSHPIEIDSISIMHN
eukprot:15364716-Ditylum_brightwellii.AAC.1